MIFRGYTAAANDGGIGGISGAGSFSVFNSSTLDFINFIDLHCHNCGAAPVLRIDTNSSVINCEINNSSANGVHLGTIGLVERCHIHDIGGIGITSAGVLIVINNFLENGAKSFTAAISLGSISEVENNIISVSGATNGISLTAGTGINIRNNSIYSSSGTGSGITITAAARSQIILNNIIEGFSGAGGKGLNLPASTSLLLYGHNKFYNNTTHETLTGDIYNNLGNNDTLGASPFASPGTDNFMVDTSVKAGAYPTSFKGSITNQFLDVGAAQREEAASGGGLLRHPGMAGGLNG